MDHLGRQLGQSAVAGLGGRAQVAALALKVAQQLLIAPRQLQ